MDLLGKVFVAAIIAVVVLIALYFSLKFIIGAPRISEQQAISLVRSDLINSNPGAVVNITNVTPSQFAGSWHIIASVITQPSSPCPSYSVYSYDYPKYGFINRTENTYTKDCVIYGMQNKSYIIASFPVAITWSYDLDVPQVMDFVKSYGFGNVTVNASYFSNTTVLSRNYTDVWIVRYSSADSNHTVSVLISQVGGNLLLEHNSSNAA